MQVINTYLSLQFDRCIEISDETCQSQILYPTYAPAAIVYTNELSVEIETITRLLDPLNPCRGFSTYMMCTYRFPACNATTGKVIPLCLEACPDINSVIELCTREFFYNNPDYPFINQLLNSFSCESQSYLNFPLQYIETDSIECVDFSKYVCTNTQYIHYNDTYIICQTSENHLTVCMYVLVKAPL